MRKSLSFFISILLSFGASAGTVKFNGEVSRSSMATLVAKVQSLSRSGDRNITVKIGDSDGGDLQAAINANAELRRYYVNTLVAGECASACTVVYAAGRYRMSSGGRFMFHAPHVASRTRDGRILSREEIAHYKRLFAERWLGAIRLVAPALADRLDRDGTLRDESETWYSTGRARALGYVNY